MSPGQIGRYPVVEEIGRGGFASVYLAEDRHLDSHVAVKVLSESFASDPDIVSRFIAEARVMRNLAAPGLVTVYDSGEHEGRPYFVMEYCERGTLDRRLEELGRPLTVEEGLGLARSMAEAMSDVHRATPSVVHRDLKPGNLLIRHTPKRRRPPVGALLAADEQLAIGDFGLAKVVDPTATRMTLIAYTRGYAAPEQARGEAAITPSADVYSASAITVAAISGLQPDPVLGAENRAFGDDAYHATRYLRAELVRGLAYDHRQRQADIDHWIASLNAAAESEPAAVATGPMADGTGGGGGTGRPASTEVVAGAGSISRRLTVRLASAAIVLLLGIAGVAAVGLAALRDGPSLIGPSEGVVGDEVVFAVTGSEVSEWRLADRETTGSALTFTPRTAGVVEIAVTTDNGEIDHEYLVTEAPSTLRIEGPGQLVIGEPTMLTVSGADEETLTWTVNGGDGQRRTSLELRPTTVGLVDVEVTTETGRTARRTFTAIPAAP